MLVEVEPSETPLSQLMPVADYGEWTVPPGTNCTVSIRGPFSSGYWRVHASVFKPASLTKKVQMAAGRLRLTLSGKPGFRPFWAPNLHEKAYRLLSPEVPGVSQLMLRSDAASWPAERDVWTGRMFLAGVQFWLNQLMHRISALPCLLKHYASLEGVCRIAALFQALIGDLKRSATAKA